MADSLSDKIAGILNAAPTSFDPEDDVNTETTARVEHQYTQDNSENDDELTQSLSQFRKQNVDLLEDVDKRYEGRRGSRKKLLQHDEWDSESESEEQEVEEQSNVEGSGNSTDEDSDDYEEYESIGENLDDITDTTNVFKDSETTLRTHTNKSSCVRQQLNIWENFLEMRIQLQKCLLTANKMPQPAHFQGLKNIDHNFQHGVEKSIDYIKTVLDKFLLLQMLLFKNYPETKKFFIKDFTEKVESDETSSDIEEQNDNDDGPYKKRMRLTEYSTELGKRFNLYHDYRNSVLNKWHDKTRIGTSKSNNIIHSVTEQIDHILSSKEKLIKATQLKRAEYDILGETNCAVENTENSENKASNKDVYNVNIFDDTDFYHHLLRELIEFKSSDLTDPVKLGRQWMQLQNLRSKMKKKVDTKATKGRKIRYVVHSKLVNFMAPIEDCMWQEGAKNELYNSLFGKNQSIKTT